MQTVHSVFWGSHSWPSFWSFLLSWMLRVWSIYAWFRGQPEKHDLSTLFLALPFPRFSLLSLVVTVAFTQFPGFSSHKVWVFYWQPHCSMLTVPASSLNLAKMGKLLCYSLLWVWLSNQNLLLLFTLQCLQVSALCIICRVYYMSCTRVRQVDPYSPMTQRESPVWRFSLHCTTVSLKLVTFWHGKLPKSLPCGLSYSNN